MVRRVVGVSMAPTLLPGKIVLATGWRQAWPGDIIIFEHEGKEKIKRVERIEEGRFFVVGDNLGASVDSRHFGPIGAESIIAVVLTRGKSHE